MSPETQSEHGEGPGGNLPVTTEGKPVKRKRRRRWLKLVVLLGVLILIIVCCLPYLLSTNAGRRLVVSVADSYLPGSVEMRDLSLSWFGPCRISGLRLHDPEGKEVARADDVVLTEGVWRGITSPSHFEQLSLDTPRVTLFVDEQGQISLLRAIATSEVSPPDQKPSPLPAVTGRLVLRNGSMKVVRPDGRELEVSHVDGDLRLEATSSIAGQLVAQAAEVGTVTGEIDLRELVRDGRFQPWGATGTARLSTPASLSLAGLGQFATGQSHADGSAQVQVRAAFGQGEIKVDTSIELARLLVRLADSSGASPVDVRLSSQLRATRESLTGHAALDGQIGDGRVDVTCSWPKQTEIPSVEDIVSGALAGKAVKWPDFVVEAKSHLDLARLAQAVPALLHIQSQVVVTGGTLDAQRVILRGGEKPSTTGAVTITRLASRRDAQITAWQPISLDWNVHIEPGTGLKVEKLALASDFANLVAKGTPSDLHADIQSNLARLQQQAAQVFNMDGVDLAGGTSGTLDLKRADQERIDLAVTLAGEGIRYRAGKRNLEVGKLSVKKNGYFTLAGSKVTRLTIADATWNADGSVAGTGSGWTGVGDGTFEVEMKIPRADLAYVAKRLVDLGVAGAAGYAGEAALQARASRSSHNAPVVSEGSAALRNTRLGNEPLLAEDVSLSWSGLSIAPDGRRFEIKSAELASTPARLAAAAVSLRTDGQPVVEGKVEGNADLARCLAIGSRIAGWDKPPAIAGRLTLSTVSQGSADGANLTGNARIDGLAIGAGEKTIREDQVRLAVKAGVNRRQETVTLDQFQMDSRMIAVKMTGTISDYARTCLLDLKGSYQASWEPISSLLHELAPATADKVTLAGASESRFTVTGTANQPQVTPTYRDASATGEVSWVSADVCGVQVGKALLTPAFKQGQLTVPVSAIPAAGGQVHLGGGVDFRPATPVLSLGPELQLLESVRITPEMGRQLLSRVNPIFGSMTRVEGTVSLITRNIQLPLGEAIKTGGSGQGRLDLQNLKVQPAGFMMVLLDLGGLTGGDNYTVQVSGVDFHLKNGRLHYDKFAMTFGPDFDLRFRGSVGFDETLDLAVSLPIRAALLQKLGVAGPTAEYARRLEKVRVEIPVVGTRLQPRMDLSQIDMKPLIEEAARSAVSQGADSLLKDLMGIKRTPKLDSGTGASERTPVAGPRTPVRPPADPAKTLEKKALDLLKTPKPGASRPAQRGLEALPSILRERTGPPASRPSQPEVRRSTTGSTAQRGGPSTQPAISRQPATPQTKPAVQPFRGIFRRERR
ncbi:MAG: hypothetical protein KA354_03030 [Phycisphaerae bacterium]|nr:hypothetical protein [Phycisphaerae bacterium]